MNLFSVLVIVGATLAVSVSGQRRSAEVGPYTAQFSGYKYIQRDITNMTTQLLSQNFDFLFLAADFDRYHRDRPGFEQLYREIADQAWADAIALLQYQSRRGFPGQLDESYLFRVNDHPRMTDELGSLQMALGEEKRVAEMAHAIHQKASVAAETARGYDPDAAHFLDRQLIKRRSGSVRKLTGYIHIVNGLINLDTVTRDMGLHLFDHSLKTVQ
ncbi:secreted ferritin G subunit [Culex quinquefasciatus]|uniref:Secreted ferritin G subunit n=1 Tax=Culex quinquefasciatus TaxID=7176 RepID=B0WVK0_CULQU|nr:secreted ferritin G subunit [Culex quinquefasciatus]|eukprot:XP_001861422.1 secreted ferritin G subunit [Culex quinquefasciatus]